MKIYYVQLTLFNIWCQISILNVLSKNSNYFPVKIFNGAQKYIFDFLKRSLCVLFNPQTTMFAIIGSQLMHNFGRNTQDRLEFEVY